MKQKNRLLGCRRVQGHCSLPFKIHQALQKADISSPLSPGLPLRWRITRLLCWEELLTWKKQISNFLEINNLSLPLPYPSRHAVPTRVPQHAEQWQKQQLPSPLRSHSRGAVREESVYLLLWTCDEGWISQSTLKEQLLLPFPQGWRLLFCLCLTLPGNAEGAARELRHPKSAALSILREMEEIGLLLPLARTFSESIISRCLSWKAHPNYREPEWKTKLPSISDSYRESGIKPENVRKEDKQKFRCAAWYGSCATMPCRVGCRTAGSSKPRYPQLCADCTQHGPSLHFTHLQPRSPSVALTACT